MECLCNYNYYYVIPDVSVINTPSVFTYSESDTNLVWLCFNHSKELAPYTDTTSFGLFYNTRSESAIGELIVLLKSIYLH